MKMRRFPNVVCPDGSRRVALQRDYNYDPEKRSTRVKFGGRTVTGELRFYRDEWRFVPKLTLKNGHTMLGYV